MSIKLVSLYEIGNSQQSSVNSLQRNAPQISLPNRFILIRHHPSVTREGLSVVTTRGAPATRDILRIDRDHPLAAKFKGANGLAAGTFRRLPAKPNCPVSDTLKDNKSVPKILNVGRKIGTGNNQRG